jgi:hypothetical protein
LDLKETNFDIHSDIGVRLGSEMKFKSRDLDFNEFPILESFKHFLNRKFGIWLENSKFKSSALNQGRDLNFKMKFGPMDLNLIYFIEFKGRFRMNIGSNFEWTWVNWTRNNFSKMQSNNFLKDFDGVLVLNLNLIRIRTKAGAFYSHYKS